MLRLPHRWQARGIDIVHTFSLLLLLETTVVAIASALQASSGMGMALFAAPLLVLVDPALVPGPTLFAVMALSVIVAWHERSAIAIPMLATALGGLVIGVPIGAALLALLSGWHLTRVFGALILIAVLLSVLGLRIRTGTWALVIGGAASGILGTMAGVHGPPIAIVLQHEPPVRLRAMLCAFFAAGCAISLIALAAVGAFGIAEIGLGLELLPGVAIGLALAPLLGRLLDRRRARLAVLIISTLSALILVLR